MVSFCFPLNTDFVIAILSISALSGPGCLIRVGLIDLLYEDFLIIPSLLPNLFGCFIMGFHEGFAQSRCHKYVKAGIATGFAGSITTFSAFNFEINILILSSSHPPQIGLYFGAIAATFIGGIILYFLGEIISLSIFSRFQKQISGDSSPYKSRVSDVADIEMTDIETENVVNNIDETDEETTNETHSLQIKKQNKSPNRKHKHKHPGPNGKYHLFEDYCIVLLWTVIFVVMYSIIIPVSFMINDILWQALLMAPVGALCRWYVGKVFNANKVSKMPLGTFIANVGGSLLFTILYVTSGEAADILWSYHKMGMTALTTGFCGCFTTVSSFVAEQFRLKREAAIEQKEALKAEVLKCEHELTSYKMSVVYFFLTLLISQILSSIINAICMFRANDKCY